MRIIGGEFRGRPLLSPRTADIRPTSDRLRESLFNILRHRYPDDLQSKRVLDLFAGTGALGLEALSQGAEFCLFVDHSAEGRALLRSNIEALQLTGRTRVFRRDATDLGMASETGSSGPDKEFGLIFADPPYGKGLGESALQSAAAGGWLKKNALAVLEESAESAFVVPQDFDLEDERSAGGSTLRFLRYGPAA